MICVAMDQAYPDLFTAEEARMVASLFDTARPLRARQRIGRAHERATHATYLLSGFAGRYRSDWLGRRQFTGFQIPGDFIDLTSIVLGHPDHDLETFTNASIALVPFDRITALRQAMPQVYDKLWRLPLIDAATQRYWTFRVGRLVGRARIANFFAEIFSRQISRGLCSPDAFALPITQTDLAEACGMTAVHANRMMGELRAEGICTFQGGEVTITDLPGLFRTGQFDWDYLYLPADIQATLAELVGREGTAPHRAQSQPKA